MASSSGVLGRRYGHRQAAPACLKSANRRHLAATSLGRFVGVERAVERSRSCKLLCEVGKRLSRAINSNDLVARMGGDEFVVVQRNISSAGEPELLAGRIVKSISALYRFGEIEVSIGASVGVSIFEIDGTTPTELLARADQAMYLSKTKQLGYSMASINSLTNLATKSAGYLENENDSPKRSPVRRQPREQQTARHERRQEIAM